MARARRAVVVAAGHEEEVLDTIRPLSLRCRENVLMLEEELRTQEPDIDDRCGLLDDRYEVYAMGIPGCRGYRLAVSIDRRRTPPTATIHGAVVERSACAAARRLATRHRKLIDPVWE